MNSRYLARVGTIALSLALLLCAGVRLLVPPDVYARRLTEFSERRDGIEIITVGNSHSRSFHFESMGLDGFHFFEQNGDIEEMERRADVLIDQLPALRYVLLALSPGALSASQRVTADDYEARRLLIRKGTPLTVDPRHYSLEEFVGTAIYRLFRIESLQKYVHGLLGYEDDVRTADAARVSRCLEVPTHSEPDDLVYDVPEEGIVDGYRRLLMKHECLATYGDSNSGSRRLRIDRSLAKKPHIVEENVRRILSLATKLQVRNAVLIVVNTPSTPWYYDSEAISGLQDRFDAAMEELTAHPNVRYLDFHELYYAELESGENPYFFDDNHLALTGAKAFSAYLSGQLDDVGPNPARNATQITSGLAPLPGPRP